MAIYVECPNQPMFVNNKSILLFMAGGITNCPNWQKDYKDLLINASSDLILLNPRRPNFDVRDPSVSEDQVLWEHNHLARATVVSFWFPMETLCPITLFELGKISMTTKKIFVGTHPEYQRKFDVNQQLRYVRPEVEVVDTLEKLATQVLDFIEK